MELARIVKNRNRVMIILFIIGFLQGAFSTGGTYLMVALMGLYAGGIYAAITYIVFSIYIYFYRVLKKP
ncbi:hypothetical protein [Marinilactibacillus kalidii]|uniref:hypothetical protein n=1 Tax=Marinilactibacillus kalidii TaxID=2820274 RepID=UPI001ABDAE77|nr:hypothetical protein [Marinilactibacillus kalidii]